MTASAGAPGDDDAADGRMSRWARWAYALYEDKPWAEIKNSLQAVGVNADAVLVDPGIGLGKFPFPWPLREALPYIAEACVIAVSLQQWSPTPNAVAAAQDLTIKRSRSLLGRLNDAKHNRIDPNSHWLQFPRLPDLERRAAAVLQELAAELERCHEAVAAMGSSRGKHNLEPHVRFWDALARIWRDNVGVKSTNDRAKFLFAASKPFFPAPTTHTALSAFIERQRLSSK